MHTVLRFIRGSDPPPPLHPCFYGDAFYDVPGIGGADGDGSESAEEGLVSVSCGCADADEGGASTALGAMGIGDGGGSGGDVCRLGPLEVLFLAVLAWGVQHGRQRQTDEHS